MSQMRIHQKVLFGVRTIRDHANDLGGIIFENSSGGNFEEPKNLANSNIFPEKNSYRGFDSRGFKIDD